MSRSPLPCAPTGMDARGGFVVGDAADVPALADGRPTRSVVDDRQHRRRMWPHYEAHVATGLAPIATRSTRGRGRVLEPIAATFDADFVHPSDEPFQPFQRWAQRADDVWKSPIGLLIHAEYGFWHAYRGAFLFAVRGRPVCRRSGRRVAVRHAVPISRACRRCPVGAFTLDGYDAAACRSHVRSGARPGLCRTTGVLRGCACPVGAELATSPTRCASTCGPSSGPAIVSGSGPIAAPDVARIGRRPRRLVPRPDAGRRRLALVERSGVDDVHRAVTHHRRRRHRRPDAGLGCRAG